MSALLAAIFDGSASAIMINGFMRMQKLPMDTMIRNQYGGHSQYLTIQGLAVSVICMSVGFLSGILPGISALRTAKRLLMIIAMPTSVVVSIIYWSLLIFFPAMILQDRSEGADPTTSTSYDAFRLPLSIDLALHAAPAVFLICDFFLFEKKYSKREASVVAPLATVLFGLYYCSWVEHCGKHNNEIYPYPFLTASNFSGRVGIYTATCLMGFGAFRLINKLHN